MRYAYNSPTIFRKYALDTHESCNTYVVLTHFGVIIENLHTYMIDTYVTLELKALTYKRDENTQNMNVIIHLSTMEDKNEKYLMRFLCTPRLHVILKCLIALNSQ